MKIEALYYLRCPLSNEKLQLVIKKNNLSENEIEEGYLYSGAGMYYPIVAGIPRMLPESMLIYKTVLQNWLPDFKNHLQVALEMFGEIINASAKRNKKIQETFGFEWSLLNKGSNIKIWNRSPESYKEQLVKELDITNGQRFALALDAGCGHGRSAMLMAGFCDVVFGVEVSAAVELGYKENLQANCHFIQADVHHLPFEKETFNLLYSSGVLHHNPSTLKALTEVSAYLKQGGLLCIWLYHPFKSRVHWLMRNYRYVTRNMHVRTVYALNCISLTPLQWIVSRLGKQKKKWYEIAIEQLDMLTPEYRHEHTQQKVEGWLENKNYTGIKITDTDDYGFAIAGTKN